MKTPIEELTPGCLVLLRYSAEDLPEALHVKRIFAVPGQTVSVDEQSRMLVDGQIPQFATAPKMLVNSERYRSDSRWRAFGNRWWRYEHRLVHRGDRPGPILDDYPGNVGIDRKLYPVSSISIPLDKNADERAKNASALEEICIWNDGQQPPFALSGENPVAVRLRGDLDFDEVSSVIKTLNIYREIMYLDTGGKTRTERPSYPIKLANDEFFVVGDNVPLSVDSRVWGPIEREDLIGQVTLKRASALADLDHP